MGSDVVDKVEESNAVCEGILGGIINEIFYQEECCANLLDDIVDQVVDDVETLNEMLEKQRIEKEEVEFLKNLSEEQKTEVIHPLEKDSSESVGVGFLNDEFTDLPSDESSAFELSDSEYDASDNKGHQEQIVPEIEAAPVEPRLEIPSLVIKK